MRYQLHTFILLGALSVFLLSCADKGNLEEATIHAGYNTLTLANPNGGNLQVAMWYPTYANENTFIYNTSSLNIDITGSVAFQGPVADADWPLIVFSHGFSGSGIGSVEICEALARSGYVVAAPDHADAVMSARIEGSASGTIVDALLYLENNPFGTGSSYLYRVSEIETVVNSLLANPDYKIDPSKLVLGGHSMGGWTVMKSLQNKISPKAMFLFSMGELNWLFQGQRYFDSPFFQTLNFPTAYFYGGVEYAQALAAGRDNVYAAYCFTHSPSPSYGLLLPQGNHFTYNSKAIAPQSGGNESQLASIINRLINYLDKHIKNRNVVVSNDPADVSK